MSSGNNAETWCSPRFWTFALELGDCLEKGAVGVSEFEHVSEVDFAGKEEGVGELAGGEQTTVFVDQGHDRSWYRRECVCMKYAHCRRSIGLL